MARQTGAKNKKTLEYLQLYDKYLNEFGCPVKVLFKIANGRYKTEHKINAARNLLPYRFAKLAAEQPQQQEQGELTLVWSDGSTAS
jgi:hypothetical protein